MAKLICTNATVTFGTTTFTHQEAVVTNGASQSIRGKAMEDTYAENFVVGADFDIQLTGYCDSTLGNEAVGLEGTTATLTVEDQNGGDVFEGSCLCVETSDEQEVDGLEKFSIRWVSAAAPTTPSLA